jgi:hypothetical protein
MGKLLACIVVVSLIGLTPALAHHRYGHSGGPSGGHGQGWHGGGWHGQGWHGGRWHNVPVGCVRCTNICK